MLGIFGSNVTVDIAILVGIAGLAYVLAASAARLGDTTAAVEFTPDGHREWIDIGTPLTPNDMNSGTPPFPDLHAVSFDRKSVAHFKATLDHVVEETLYVIDVDEAFAVAGKVRKEAYAKARPQCASNLIGVSRLAFPEQLIEIVFKAVLPPA